MSPQPFDERTLHSLTYRVLAVIAWTVSTLWCVALLWPVDDRTLRELPLPLALALFAYVSLWRPQLRIDPEGIELINVTHRVRIPWPAVTGVERRHALGIRTKENVFSSWALTASGRPMMRRLWKPRPQDAQVEKTEGREWDAMAAADLVDDAWQEVGPRLAASGTVNIRRRPHLLESVLLLGLITAFSVMAM